MPEVSVIIPTHNYGHFIKGAIKSVLSQSFSDLELIVVDDGSTDGTKNFISAFKDSRILYINQKNRGLASARNNGIKIASGEYVGFLDADDLWMPEKLELQLSIFKKKENVGLVYTGYEVVDDSGTYIAKRKAHKIEGDLISQLILGNIVSGSATTSLIRGKCFKTVGLFDETLRSCEDWDMWLRIARVWNFECINQPLAKIRLHSDNMTNDPRRIEKGLFSVIEKFYSDENLSSELSLLKPMAMAGAHRDSANFYVRSGLYKEAFSHLIKAIWMVPNWCEGYQILGYLLYRILSNGFEKKIGKKPSGISKIP
jgi:glycosyltransferase involved in cell wall biosynthesis